jgi:hypothetical protein
LHAKVSAVFDGVGVHALNNNYGNPCTYLEEIVFFHAAGNGWRRAVRVILMSS